MHTSSLVGFQEEEPETDDFPATYLYVHLKTYIAILLFKKKKTLKLLNKCCCSGLRQIMGCLSGEKDGFPWLSFCVFNSWTILTGQGLSKMLPFREWDMKSVCMTLSSKDPHAYVCCRGDQISHDVRGILMHTKRKFCFKSKLVCQSAESKFFHQEMCSMRHYSASPEFSNRSQTPVSAVGCCSLLNGGSSSFIALTVNESIKDLTDFRQDPLHHSPQCWNELWSLVWGEEASWVWAFFLVLLRFLTPTAAISLCQWQIYWTLFMSVSPRGQGSGVETRL